MGKILLLALIAGTAECYVEAVEDGSHAEITSTGLIPGSKASYERRLKAVSEGVAFLYGRPDQGEGPMGKRCAFCHGGQVSPKVVGYTIAVGGTPEAPQKVEIDFTKLDSEISRLLKGLPELVPFSGEGKRAKLDKTQSFRLLTALHRMGIHFQDTEEKKARESIRAFLGEFSNLSESVIDTFLKFKAPFPDVEFRRRVTQIFGRGTDGTPPPETLVRDFVELGVAVGIPAETTRLWIQQAPGTRITADQDR